uniref:Uncharacterized protein n=1 Tax=Candidatus Desulfatibia profunda TaxID=2841695 RepID=A0A8J6NRC6_9BACT|nr:hypothetical protein [Candidatus Desulfatibia profunda]
MATNKDPFVYSRNKDGKPVMFKGLVQAGSTQAIKRGELCTWNETTGYFIPVNAVADHRYWLAIAAEEQKASGRHELTAIRYIDFYALHPNDIFEFALAAAAAIAYGDPYTLTASDSQKLTAAAGAFAVAISVGDGNYPQEEDTTLRNQSYGLFSFNPAVTWWGNRMSQEVRGGRKVIAVAATETLKESDMYNSLILISGTTVVTLPAVKPGMDAVFISADGADQSIDPNSADKIRLDGALLDDGDKISQTTIGYYCNLITENADGFCCIAPVGTWTDGS